MWYIYCGFLLYKLIKRDLESFDNIPKVNSNRRRKLNLELRWSKSVQRLFSELPRMVSPGPILILTRTLSEIDF